MHEVVTGTGYVSNAIYVLLGLWWLVRTKHRDAAAIAWGVTLASRANFLFLVPVMCGYLRQTTGLRPALRATALTCATAACLTIPFYLYDRPNFGPIEGANRLLVFSDLLPHLGLALMVLMAVLAFVLSFSPMDAPALFRNCALVQALPVVAGVVLSTVQDRQLNLWYARYGPFFSWFALIALAAALSNSRAACRASDTRLPFWRLNLTVIHQRPSRKAGSFRHRLRGTLTASSRMSRSSIFAQTASVMCASTQARG
jgi:hypothetical protein